MNPNLQNPQGLYAIYLNIMQAGGLSGFQSLSVALVSESKMTTIEAINIVSTVISI